MKIYQRNMRSYFNFYFNKFLENRHICVKNGTKLLNWNAIFFFNPLDYINKGIIFVLFSLKNENISMEYEKLL